MTDREVIDNIRLKCRRCHLSYTNIARYLGLSTTTVSNYFRGITKPTEQIVTKLLRAVDCLIMQNKKEDSYEI